ncbi:MAG: NBR1-Ig-like domain-containing protein [Anaerolineae bacterium]|jgi:hypothetical protein
MEEEKGTKTKMDAETPVSRFMQRIGLSRLVLGLVALLVVAALLLPPISLLDRLGVVGYETLSPSRVAVSHPDGLTLQVDPETFAGRIRVKLESVPRLEFLEGSAGRELKEAAEALPDSLDVKSPYYGIKMRGAPSGQLWIDVAVPNDAEPWETLDLYSWNGETWRWLGSDLHTEATGHEFLRADVTEIPDSVVVVQSGMTVRRVATYVDSDDNLNRASVFDTLNPTGLLLGTMGGFAGDVDSVVVPEDDPNFAVLPTLRNWAEGGSVNEGLVGTFLDDAEAQEQHIQNIVDLCIGQGFDGVEIDYRGIAEGQRAAYVSFIGALADALQAEDMTLSVTVERPDLVDGAWETGGYDLRALGEMADAVRVPFPADPEAYADGGKAHRLLDWATAQVPRQKLMMLVSSLSTSMDEGTDVYRHVTAEEVLEPFGQVELLEGTKEVEPNSPLAFGLKGSLMSTSPHEDAGTYSLRYKKVEGTVCTAWLGTAAHLKSKLSWAKRYHLGGVVVADALDPGNTEGVLDVVAAYPDIEPVSVPGLEDMQIAWEVARAGQKMDGQAGPLANPSFTWTAPKEPGVYQVSASVVGYDHGSVAISVVEPEPPETPSKTITETETITETAETDEEEGEKACLNATFVADVTVPDNTQMDKGESFEKTWQIQNSGSCAWPEDTVLAYVSGEQMGAPDSVDVPVVEPGGEEEITVQLQAPEEDGRYTGEFRLKSGDNPFGGQFWVKIVVGEPQQTTPPPAPPPSGGGSFELGGHIRDWGFPHADRMHYAGMNWAKVQVRYPQDASGIINAAHANGFKIQVSALGSADMVTESNFEQKVANWVAGMAAAGADAIEVWNEPNIDREWQMGHIGPQAYTNLLCAAYRAVKNANARTAVISAAPAPTGSFGGGCQPNGGNCDDVPFLQGMYNAGAAQCMDYIGAHHNSGATSPSARTGHPADGGGHHHSWYFLPQTELYYNTFRGTRKLFYTEMGYASQEGVPPFSDWFAWARGTNNAEQAAWLKEAVQLSINTGMVRCIIVWNIDYVRYGYDPQDGYAIIRPDGSCPACESLHSVLGRR